MLTTKLYVGYKVYGPYVRKADNRKQVSLVNGKDYITLQYAKFLIQEHIGRLLLDDEQVHHEDEDKTNDAIDNLSVVKNKEHTDLHTKLKHLTYDFECQMCSRHIVLTHRQYLMVQYRIRNKQNSPFCSQRCAANYGNKFVKG